MNRILGALFLLPIGLFATQLITLKSHIEVTADPLVAVTTLNHTFNTLGYKIQIKTISTENLTSRIDAELIGLKPLTSAVLAESFQENGIKVLSARIDGETMDLNIDATAAIWNIQKLNADEGIALERSNSTYWFRIEADQIIRIEPAYGGKWYPDVSVLDKSMRILYTARSDKSANELKFLLPEGAYYLKISNTNGMKALKEGMWVESMSTGR